MGVYETTTRTFVCDRCGDKDARDETQINPVNWVNVSRVSVLCDVGVTVLLCPDCARWLNKFLEGRKVED